MPAASADPPDDAANQLNVPALAAAERETVPASQRLAGVVPVIVGVVFTVAITVVRADVHPLLVAST